MLRYSRRSSKQKELELHLVIRDFKIFQQQRKILQNRINIMQQKQSSNVSKAKYLEEQLERIKGIKEQRRLEQQQIQKEKAEQRQRDETRKKQIVRRINEEKKKIQTSKRFYSEFKQHLKRKARSESKLNTDRIHENREKMMRENLQRHNMINAGQQLGKTKVCNFKQGKLEGLKAEFKEKLVEQIKINQKTREELTALQNLQKQVLLRYSESIKSLRNSRTNLKKVPALRC